LYFFIIFFLNTLKKNDSASFFGFGFLLKKNKIRRVYVRFPNHKQNWFSFSHKHTIFLKSNETQKNNKQKTKQKTIST